MLRDNGIPRLWWRITPLYAVFFACLGLLMIARGLSASPIEPLFVAAGAAMIGVTGSLTGMIVGLRGGARRTVRVLAVLSLVLLVVLVVCMLATLILRLRHVHT